MILGGLKEGVTPLDMAHAYETFARAAARSTTPSSAPPSRAPPGSSGSAAPAAARRRSPTSRPTSRCSRRRSRPPCNKCSTGVGPDRHGHQRPDPRRDGRREDRNDLGLRRRLVRRVDAADDDRGVGRLPQRPGLDGPRLRAGRSRAAPTRRSSGRLHDAGAPDPGLRGAQRKEQNSRPTRPGTDTTVTLEPRPPRRAPDLHRAHDTQRRRPRPTPGRRSGGPAAAPARPAAQRRRGRHDPAAGAGPDGGGGGTPAAAAAPRAAAAARPAAAAAPPAGWRHRRRRRDRWRRRHLGRRRHRRRRHRRALGRRRRLRAAASARRSRLPADRGRDTNRLPAATNRHGSSAALVIPIRVSTPTSTSRHAAGRAENTTGPRSRSQPLCSSSIPSAWVSLPGPEQRPSSRCEPAPQPHQLDPVERLERADQHRGADALGLADRVQQRVDPVGAVHVGVARAVRTAASCAASAPRTRGAAGSESW